MTNSLQDRFVAKANSEGNRIPPIKGGCYLAVCYQFIDTGSQYNETYGNYSDKIMLGFELPDEVIEVEKDGVKEEVTRVISKEYTMSLNEKANLRKDLESWRGKTFTPEELEGFDVTTIVGKPCQIQIINKKSKTSGKDYAIISSIISAPKGMKDYKGTKDLVIFGLHPSTIDRISEFPKWIQEKIKASETYKHIMNPIPEKSLGDVPPPSADDYELSVEEKEELPF